MPDTVSTGEDDSGSQVNPEELASAKDIIQSIVKTSKAFKMYLPNNPLHRKFFTEFNDKLVAFLHEFGDFKVDIQQFTLSYRGAKVYENRDLKESFAFKLYSDGVVTLIFSEGIEEAEAKRFMDILGGNYNDLNDDIATLLWTYDLPHIRYSLQVDEGITTDPDELGMRKVDTDEQQKGFSEAGKEVEAAEPAPTPVMAPQNILSLSEKELEWLNKAKEMEEKKKPADEVAYILYSIIAVEKDHSLFADFSTIAAGLIRDIILMGELKHAAGLISSLRKLLSKKDFPAENRVRLKSDLEGILNEEVVEGLGNIISAGRVRPDNLKALLLSTGGNAIAPLCKLLGIVGEKREIIKVIADILADIGKGSSEEFFPFLKDKRGQFVRTIIQILGKIGAPKALEQVGGLAAHREENVKREVLQYLKGSDDPGAAKYLLKFLDDENIAMRVRALKLLASPRYGDTLDAITDIVKSEDFEERDLSERIALFETIGAIGSDKDVPMIQTLLVKKFWFNKAREFEATSCAVAALARIKTENAIKALEEAVHSKKGESRALIERTIKHLKSAKKVKSGGE